MPKILLSLFLFLFAQFALAVDVDDGLIPLPKKPKAPDFETIDLEGKSHRLSDYRGKVVIVNFWATWCPPCRAEMPSMQRAWEELRPEGVVLLAVNMGERRETVAGFLEDNLIDFPLLLDGGMVVSSGWPVQGLPTTYVVDPQGRAVYAATGMREWDAPTVLGQIRSLKN
jgi:thiol-disulfide isomerase/thioredoxin